MIDDRLELRLRGDPTGDPIHEVGLFRARLSRVAVVRARARPTALGGRSIAGFLAAAVILAFVIAVQPTLGPGEPTVTPTPSPSPSPDSTFNPEELNTAVRTWRDGLGLSGSPGISVTIFGSLGSTTSYGEGDLPTDPSSGPSARIGEVSRVYLAAAIAVIDACTGKADPLLCTRPVFGTTLTLDDPVSKWYPAIGATETITLRHLAEGSSGLASVAEDLSDLSTRVASEPGTDWSPEAAIARAIAAPRRFAPGEQRAPVDTDYLILEAVMNQATGLPEDQVIPTGGYPPFETYLFDQQPLALMPGSRRNGEVITDLDPAVLALVRNADGIAVSSQELAEYAVQAWGPASIFDPPTIDLLTDAANGHANPLGGAVGLCPCAGATRSVIRAVGHAVGWTVLMAYDDEHRTGVGVVIGRDIPVADVQTLLERLLGMDPDA